MKEGGSPAGFKQHLGAPAYALCYSASGVRVLGICITLRGQQN